MILDFSKIDLKEPPILILKNAGGKPIGVLGSVIGLSPEIKYNETSVIEFDLPYSINGAVCPFYDDVVGVRIVELQGLAQFILINPEEQSDGLDRRKHCKGYSLEYEFALKNITIAAGTHNFWNPINPENTIIGMILEVMPGWKIGRIPDSLADRYRTIEAESENVYNLMKNTLQESFGCIFDFDTINRLIHVRDVNDTPDEKAVYISASNLASEISVEENTEEMITRLDVRGADGVDIRDVNPTGTNQIINLDYFMTPVNFDEALIEKYYAWKNTVESNMEPFYSLSIDYSMAVMQKATAEAELAELKHELTSLENIQAVVIQAIAQGISTKDELTVANRNIDAKNREITAQEGTLAQLTASIEDMLGQMQNIRNACRFESYFTEAEQLEMNPYIKDGSISDSTFVAVSTDSYSQEDIGERISGQQFSISNAQIEFTSNDSGRRIYSIRGGSVEFGDEMTASIIRGTVEIKEGNALVATIRLSAGKISGADFPSACISITGTASGILDDLTEDADIAGYFTGTSLSFKCTDGYSYFTYDVSEYERRSVAWDLFEFGRKTLEKLSQPAYTFHVTSANFLAMEDFEAFKNDLELGQKLYVELCEGKVLSPICIGAKFEYDDHESLDLEFGDSYTSSDSSFRLADLLNQSISMGKNADLSKYTNSAYVDSGAEVGIKAFINSALDVSKNAILSSNEQALSIDGAGLRLRKWANEDHTAYEDEQIWMNNNAIMMTDDGWATAEMAIGKFYDDNAGECWGIVAPRIVGTLIAGGSLIIESEKADLDGDGVTEVATFRVDGDGCKLYNADMAIASEKAHIMLNPDLGIAIGKFPVYQTDENGERILDETNANFWVDAEGNVHIKGTLHGTDGEFSGTLKAADGVFTGTLQGVDGEFTGSLDVKSGEHHITINNQLGIAIGKNPVYTTDSEGVHTLNSDNAQLWIDHDGNLKFTGVLDGASGNFTGAIHATGLTIDSNGSSVNVDEYVDDRVSIQMAPIKSEAEKMAEAIQNISSDIGNLQDQIDGNITTWFYGVPPTNANEPASGWTDMDTRNQHLGDLYYDTETGYCYRWQLSSGTYSWQRLTDSDVTKALADAAAAKDTADQKRRVFVQQPTPPYDEGDIWTQGEDGEILVCVTPKSNGQSFSLGDWKAACKYSDDSKANEALELALGGVASVDMEYYLSDSTTELIGGEWQTTAPEWTKGKFMWSRTVTLYKDGTYAEGAATCIAGAAGTDGSDGVGVKSITNYYLASAANSGVTRNTSGWTTDVQTVTSNKKYLWNYEVVTYTNGNEAPTDPCIIGNYAADGIDGKDGTNGTNGSDGADGRGIVSITEYYQVSSSNTTVPTSWETDVPAMTTTNRYLWNYEVITYTEGSPTSTAKRVIGVYGDTGAAGTNGTNGVGVKSIVEQYYLSSSKTTQTGGSWGTSVPTWVLGTYIWTRSLITYTNNTTDTTTPYCDTSWEVANEVAIYVSDTAPTTTPPAGKIWLDTSGEPPIFKQWLGLNLSPDNEDGWAVVNDTTSINQYAAQLSSQQNAIKQIVDQLNTAMTVDNEGVHVYKPGNMNTNEVFIDENSVDIIVGGNVASSFVAGGAIFGDYRLWRPEGAGGLAFNLVV